MVKILSLFILFIAIWTPHTSQAETISLSFSDISEWLDPTRQNSDENNGLIQALEQELNQLNLRWQGEALGYTISERALVLEPGCGYNATLERLDGVGVFNEETGLSIQLESLSDPLLFTILADIDLSADGKIEQTFGIRPFSDCLQYAEDGFNFTLNGDARISLDLELQLNPEITRSSIRFSPEFSLKPIVSNIQYSIQVKGSLLEDSLEDQLRKEIDDALKPSNLEESALELVEQLENSITALWQDEFIEFELPELRDEEISQLGEFITQELQLPVTQDYLRDHLPELLYAALNDDNSTLGTLASNLALCELTNAALIPPQSAPLYYLENNICSSTPANTALTSGDYFSDENCQNSVQFTATSSAEFCANTIDNRRVGDASLLQTDQTIWTQSPGTRIDIGVWSTTGKNQPYSTSLSYKTVATEHGSCQLEMRVYSPQPGARGLQPVLAIHGGSWQYRNNGIIGIESQVAHFTDTGMIVFAPFYRVTGTDSGPAACQQASAADIVSDISDALDWVRTEGKRYGAAGHPVMVTGQSAGAHLSAWLATYRADAVARALLLYPPTDMGDYLQQYLAGNLGEPPSGLGPLSRFLDLDRDNLDITDPTVVENSFPTVIAANPSRHPPMFMIHGRADSLVPARQSQRLCGSLSGNPDDDATTAVEEYTVKQVFACDQRGSQLHLITQGEHTLDICAFSIFCPAGDQDSRLAVQRSLETAVAWLAEAIPQENHTVVDADAVTANATSGGGSLAAFNLLLLLWVNCYRQIRNYRTTSNNRGDYAPIPDA